MSLKNKCWWLKFKITNRGHSENPSSQIIPINVFAQINWKYTFLVVINNHLYSFVINYILK